MKRLSIPILLFFLIFSCSCKKDPSDRNYIIKGRILECSSNPVPIKNYRLKIWQPGVMNGPDGSEKESQTDGDGYFSINFQPTHGSFLGGTNDMDLDIWGIDTIQYPGLGSRWEYLKAQIDTNLNTIYLFKKIDLFVRKIQVNTALNATDSIKMLTYTGDGIIIKTIYGPVAAGTLLVVDTINQLKVNEYDLRNNIYTLGSSAYTPHYSTDPYLRFAPGDEAYGELVVEYH